MRALLRYAVAVLSILLAWLVRAALDSWLGDVQPFATFYIAVTFVAWWAGWRPGLLALVLGYFAAHWFFLPPRHALALENFADIVQHVAYFFVTGTIVILMHSLRQAHARESASAQAARSKQKELESQAQQRQRAEEQLRFQLQLLQSITSTAAVCIFVTDEQGHITFMNPEAERVFGFSFSELRGRLMHEAIHHHYPDGRPFPQSECPIGKVYESGQTTRAYEEVFFRKDGSAVPVVCSNAALWGEGKVAGAVLVAQDITERKQAEMALREQAQLAQLRADAILVLQQPDSTQALLQSVAGLLVERLDAAFARVWTLDAAGQTLALQASAGLYTHLDGGHSHVPVGQLKIGRIALERHPLVTNQVNGDPHVPNQDWARREGLVAFAGFPLLLEGRLLGVVALFARHALSPAAVETLQAVAGALAQALGRKQSEEALRSAQEELARANAGLERKVQGRTVKLREAIEELEGFSYSLVHDMRTPLRAMQMYASALEEDSGARLDPEGLEYLRKIKLAANRMDLLIQDSLNYSRVMREELPLKPVNVGGLLRGLVETYPNLQAPGAEVKLEVGDLLVLGNEAALTQVFSNLLGNAVKFVAPGVKPKVRVWAQAAPRRNDLTSKPEQGNAEKVLIWVEDNGIGIPRQGQEKIFGMFQRMHRTDEYPGTGIGLAIVRKSLERIGGRAGVKSEPGKGSRFWVELPLAQSG